LELSHQGESASLPGNEGKTASPARTKESLPGNEGKITPSGEDKKQILVRIPSTIKFKLQLTLFLLAASITTTFAQDSGDGEAGIREATDKVKGYFDTGTDLMYAIGAVVGLVGAVKVFNKWNAGEPDTGKVAAAWFGSCIFLVVVATVLKSFFGI